MGQPGGDGVFVAGDRLRAPVEILALQAQRNRRPAAQVLPPARVVEVLCLVNRHGAVPLAQPALPPEVAGLMAMLGEYQALAFEAAWNGGRANAIRALASDLLVFDLCKARAAYDELASAQPGWLPQRLLH